VKSLGALQGEFLASLLRDDEAPPRIAIYRRNVLAALSGALEAAYPVTLRLVGAAFFREAARTFARATPSASGDLHAYGGEFPEFLSRYPHARSLEYLPDVARLEWACHESSLAADAGRFDFEALARVAPERGAAIRFALAPAVRLVASPHPVVSIWEANQPGRDGTPRRSTGAEHALVWRADGEVRVERLGEGEWGALAAFARGATLAEASGCLGADAAAFLGDGLARHVRDGIVAAFAAPGEAM